MPFNPPPGWNALQEKAREAKDPQELSDLIAEMNRMLSEYERTAGDGDFDSRRPRKQKTAKASCKKRNGS